MEMAFLNILVGFDLKTQMIALDALLPSKKVPDGAMTSRKFQQIKASIVEVGLIEPLSVSRPDVFKDEFLLLEALLNATPPEQLADSHRPPKIKPTVTPDHIAKLEREMDKVQGQYQQAEQTYGAALLHLVVAKGYLSKLLANEAVQRYLNQHQPEILKEFQALVDTVALDPDKLGMADDVEDEDQYLESGDGEEDGGANTTLDHLPSQTAEIVTIAKAE